PGLRRGRRLPEHRHQGSNHHHFDQGSILPERLGPLRRPGETLLSRGTNPPGPQAPGVDKVRLPGTSPGGGGAQESTLARPDGTPFDAKNHALSRVRPSIPGPARGSGPPGGCLMMKECVTTNLTNLTNKSRSKEVTISARCPRMGLIRLIRG